VNFRHEAVTQVTAMFAARGQRLAGRGIAFAWLRVGNAKASLNKRQMQRKFMRIPNASCTRRARDDQNVIAFRSSRR
jgi:hypothetical protein